MRGGGGGRGDSEQRRASCDGVRAARRQCDCKQRREGCKQRRGGGIAVAWGRCVRRRAGQGKGGQ